MIGLFFTFILALTPMKSGSPHVCMASDYGTLNGSFDTSVTGSISLSGSLVNSITDQSASAIVASGSGGTRPAYSATGMVPNSKPAITHLGGSQFLDWNSSLTYSTGSIVAVLSFNSLSGAHAFLGNVTGSPGVIFSSGTTILEVSDPTHFTDFTVSIATGTRYIIEVDLNNNPATTALYINNVSQSISGSTGATFSAVLAEIGGRNHSSSFFDGSWSEIDFYPTALNSTNRTGLYNCLASKW